MAERDPLACALSWVSRILLVVAVVSMVLRRAWILAGLIVRGKEKPNDRTP